MFWPRYMLSLAAVPCHRMGEKYRLFLSLSERALTILLFISQTQPRTFSVHTIPTRLSAENWKGISGSSHSVPCCACQLSRLLPLLKSLPCSYPKLLHILIHYKLVTFFSIMTWKWDQREARQERLKVKSS